MPYHYKKLKAAREKKGWSKTDLGKKIDLSDALIGLIEKGERQGPASIKAYADKVGISMDEIVISDEVFEQMRAQDATPPKPATRRREPVGSKR